MKLKNIGKITTGKTPSKKVESAFGNYIQFLTPRDFNGQRYSDTTERSLSVRGMEAVKNAIVKGPSISVTCIGSDMGKTIFNKKDIVSNQQINSISDIKSEINPMFLYYLLCTKQRYLHFIGSSQGSTMPILNKRDFGNLTFKFPTRSDQDEVVNKINILDSKIELNNQINDNLQKLASTYFQFFLKKIETTNVLLEEVANIKSGGDKPKDITSKKDSDHLIPIFSNGMTNEGLYGYTKIAKIKEKAITVSARGTIGYTCLRTEPYFPIVRLISVIPYPKISVYYLYLWLLNTDIQGFGTTQQQLTVPVFKKYSVSIPKDLKDMSFFDNHVSVFFEQIQKNKEETKLLKEIKESLLKKLF